MDVERVDQVELREVREVDAHELPALHADRVLRVVEGQAVDRVEVVLAVAVRVVAVHHHHQLAGGRARLGRVDDQRAVEALLDVLLERRRVAVVEVHAVRVRLELVRERASGRDDLEDAVHVRGVDAVEVDRVRVRAVVGELDAEDVALGCAQHRPGHSAVVRPRGVGDSLRHLDLAVLRDERVLAHPPGLCGERLRRDEQRVEVVGAARRRNARRRPSTHGPCARAGGRCGSTSRRRRRPARPSELRERHGGHRDRRSGQKLPPAQAV